MESHTCNGPVRTDSPSDDHSSVHGGATLLHQKGAAGVFSKEQIEGLFGELKRDYGMEPDWEIDSAPDAHLGVAYSDANTLS